MASNIAGWVWTVLSTSHGFSSSDVSPHEKFSFESRVSDTLPPAVPRIFGRK